MTKVETEKAKKVRKCVNDQLPTWELLKEQIQGVDVISQFEISSKNISLSNLIFGEFANHK